MARYGIFLGSLPSGAFPQTLVASSYVNASAFGAAVISTTITLAATGYANVSAYGNAVISQSGPQTLTAGSYVNTQYFGSAVVSTGGPRVVLSPRVTVNRSMRSRPSR